MLILASDSATYLQLRHENSLKNLPSSNLVRCWPSGSAVMQCGYIEGGEQDPFWGCEEMLAIKPNSGFVAAHKSHAHKLLTVGFTA